VSVSYRLATVADGTAAAAAGRRCFDETFGAHFPADDHALHLDRMFGPAGLPAELADPDVRVMLAEEKGAIAGYLKLVPMTLPVDRPPGALEIKQLYVLAPWQGAGVAQALTRWAIETARGDGAPALFLSVWEGGARARAFYARQGFAIVGHAPFTVGTRIYQDPVMRLDLE
jgi:diamine N-acetyltransferase